MKNLIKNLENLDKRLSTNKDVDWTENNPNEEFNSLSYIVKEIIKRAKTNIPTEKQLKLDKLGDYVYAEDDKDLENMLNILENYEDQDQITGWIDGIQMCETFETSFTVKSLLQQIS